MLDHPDSLTFLFAHLSWAKIVNSLNVNHRAPLYYPRKTLVGNPLSLSLSTFSQVHIFPLSLYNLKCAVCDVNYALAHTNTTADRIFSVCAMFWARSDFCWVMILFLQLFEATKRQIFEKKIIFFDLRQVIISLTNSSESSLF